MSLYVNNGMNYSPYYMNSSFRGTDGSVPNIINKPVKKVEDIYNKTVGSVVKEPEDNEKQKSHKKAVTVGSTVLVISALAALLNPKFSGKFVGKMQTLSKKAEAKMHNSKDSFIKTKLYSSIIKFFNGAANVANFSNTLNAGKDVGFKWLCSAEKFGGVKNDTMRNVLQKGNHGFTKFMTKINNSITKWFDDVGKSTVYRHYGSASKNLDDLDEAIKLYRKRLTPSEQKLVDAKLKELAETRKFFSEEQIKLRLKDQEKQMGHLEKDFKDKLINGYFKKFKGFGSAGTFEEKSKHNWNLVKDNMSYWAEDMMMPTRNKIEKNGQDVITKLVGNGKDVKGGYQEIIDILEPHMKDPEKKILNEFLKTNQKKLTKANHSECVEYFDKKRDLMLGGAPTDILTNLGFLGLSGLAIGTADTKEERVSRALTMGFPAIAGIGTSIAMTAMLFSGVQGMAIGAVTGGVMSKVGSTADKYLNPKAPVDSKPDKTNLDPNNPKKLPEVMYA